MYVWMYYVLALCLYCSIRFSAFSLCFFSYYIDVRLSHVNKDYLLTYLQTVDVWRKKNAQSPCLVQFQNKLKK